MWHGLLALLLASSQRGLIRTSLCSTVHGGGDQVEKGGGLQSDVRIKDRERRARFNMDWVREDSLVLLQRGERTTTNSSAEGIIREQAATLYG